MAVKATSFFHKEKRSCIKKSKTLVVTWTCLTYQIGLWMVFDKILTAWSSAKIRGAESDNFGDSFCVKKKGYSLHRTKWHRTQHLKSWISSQEYPHSGCQLWGYPALKKNTKFLWFSGAFTQQTILQVPFDMQGPCWTPNRLYFNLYLTLGTTPDFPFFSKNRSRYIQMYFFKIDCFIIIFLIKLPYIGGTGYSLVTSNTNWSNS